jgi:DNA-binding CsgD family transcriptional regulator/N-acetylneuraminic acid mutarotase
MTDENELSDREIEIIRLVATGASNKEIANALTISPNTVKVHLRNIFGKLGVLSRTEATMTAIRMGLVDSPGVVNQTGTRNEVLPADDMNWQVQQQDILTNVNSSKKNLFLIVGLGLIILVLAGFLLNRVLSPSNEPEGGITVAELEELSSKRWTTIQNLPDAISNMGFVRYENKFLIFGGVSENSISDKLHIYDLDDDTWTEGANLPIALKDIQVAILGERIYLPGGIDNTNEVKSGLLIYNPRSNKWEEGGELPIPVSAYALVPYEGKIYLFGGFDGKNYLDSIYVFDPGIDEWILFGSMETNRAYSSAVVLGGQIHLMGGKNESGILVDHTVYYPQRELSGEDAWEDAAELPEARYGMNSIVLADMIYTAGGKNSNEEFLPVIQYLPPRDSWLEVETAPNEIGDSPAVLPYETRLYILGGLNSEGYSNQSLVYQAVYTILVPVIQKD